MTGHNRTRATNWLTIGTIAAGILLTAIVASLIYQSKLAYNNSRHYNPGSESKPGYTVCLKIPPVLNFCPSDQHSAESEAQRDKDDLAAQQEMADWAFVVSLTSAAGFCLSLVGLFLIYATLSKTSEAINVSEQNSRDETRAYVHADRADLFLGSPDVKWPSVVVTVKNTGATPAKWFSVVSATRLIPVDHVVPRFSEFEISPIFKQWNALGGGLELSATLGVDVAKELRDAYMSDPSHFMFIVAGVVRYETFFREIFETEFMFTRRGLPRYQQRKIGGMEGANVFEEIPIKLTRPVGTLESYRSA